MRFIFLVLIIFSITQNAHAAVSTCPAQSPVVIYINGILAESYAQKKKETEEFKRIYHESSDDGKTHFEISFNPSRWGGVGDLASSIAQSGNYIEPYQGDIAKKMQQYAQTALYNPAAMVAQAQELRKYYESQAKQNVGYDVDLLHMISSLQKTVHTDKIVIVGHSQGTFYANALYHHLIHNGVPEESVAVFNIATPAAYVAGQGGYFTATNDHVINTARDYQRSFYGYGALPGKAHLPPPQSEVGSTSPWRGHSLLGVYLDKDNQHTYDDHIIERIHNAVVSRKSIGSREECIPSAPLSGTVSTLPQKAVITAVRGFEVAGDTLFIASDSILTFAWKMGEGVGDIIIAATDTITQLLANVTGSQHGASVVTSLETPHTNTPPSLEPSTTQQPRTTHIPEVVAFVQQNSSAIPSVPNQNAPAPTQSPQPVSFGGLAPLGFGSGAGGGGEVPRVAAALQQHTQSTPSQSTQAQQTQTQQSSPPPQPQTQTNTGTAPAPSLPTCSSTEELNSTKTACVPKDVVCTAPEIRHVETNTCVRPVPTCAVEEILNLDSTLCIPRPVICTTPRVRDATTNTCILPTRTGPTPLPDTFTENTTLSYLASPYTSRASGSQTITIPEHITVTIEAGALLHLAAETKFAVFGTLRIIGTQELPVGIDSIYELGGSPNKSTHPWSGLFVHPSGTLEVEHVHISYGGWKPGGAVPSDFPSATILNSGTTTLRHVTISHSQNPALVHTGGLLTVETLTVDTAPTGLSIRAPQYDIRDVHIRNTTTAVTLSSLFGRLSGTTGENNAHNGITITSQAIREGETAHLYGNTLAYYSEDNHTIAGTLQIHPGAFVQNADNTYTVSGKVEVGEGSGNPPILTSLWDNATQGEPRGTIFPNKQRAPTVGDWKGMLITGTGSVSSGIEERFGEE